MAAPLTTSTWASLAFDYSDYYERIATALETIAVASSATYTTLGTISTTLTTISNSASASANSAASSTATNADLLTSVQQIASSATFIGVMLESIASVNATSAATVSGVIPTFSYPGSGLTTSTAVFFASVGGTTGTTMYVSNITSGVIVPNMVLTGTNVNNNIVVRQTSGTTGNTGTYELLYNTGYRISLNQGNSTTSTVTGNYTTGSIASITSTNILTTLQQIIL
jgi:hypothetical protein